ncbi:MAG: hypothetical protein GXO43_10140 [Crenarchaeota archaeon]|nr:hypothetical protein [Thermoproteota archaeon]
MPVLDPLQGLTYLLTVKYVLVLIAIAPLIAGSLLVDKMRRLGRALRVFAYAYLFFLVGIDYLWLHILLPLSYPFLVLLGTIGLAVTLYTEGYSRVLLGMARPLQIIVEILSVALLLLFTSTLVIEFVMYWILTELVGFMIIIFDGTRESWRAAITYLVIGALTADFSLFTLLAVIAEKVGLTTLFSMTLQSIIVQGISVGPFLTVLILLGFIAKSALVPLHFWLPDAYTLAPSPASASFSGIMEKMSIFGVLLVTRLVHLDPSVTVGLFLGLGTITIFYAATQAMLQTDAKKLLSYSTMAYSGCLMTLVAVYVASGMTLPMYLAIIMMMFAHGLSKSLLFLNAGTMEILANTREIYRLGYLARIDRNGAFSIVMGGISLLGVPSTIGFVGKLYAIIALITTYFSVGAVALPAIAAFIYLSSTGIVYTLKYLGSYYGGYKPLISGIRKYYLLDIGEAVGVASIIVFGAAGAVYLYEIGLSPYIVVADLAVVAALGVLLYIIKKRGIWYREDEPWLGGAYP